MNRILAASLVAFASLLGPTASQAADKLSVLLEWYVNPDHAPMVIAKEKGLFAAQGLDVELIPPSDPSAVPRLVSAGQADIGIHYQPNLFLDHEAGLPLVRFGTLVETPLNTVTVLANGPIKSLKDLKGKKVGFSVSGFEDAMLKKMLSTVDLTNADVELINVNFSLSPSLIGGKVDATLGAFRNFELTQMKIEGSKGFSFFPEEHGVPAYDELIYVTRRDLAADSRLPRFLAATEQAAIFMTNHPDEAWALFAKAYPNLDDELNKTAFFDTLPRFAKRPAALDRGRYARFSAFMQEMGLVKASPKPEDVAVEIR